jgi:hypothetical protein
MMTFHTPLATVRRLAIVLAAVLGVGCANVQIDATGPTPATVDKLRAAELAPAQVGKFQLAAGKPAEMDTGLSGLRGSTAAPAKGSWSQLLKDTLAAELRGAGLLDEKSSLVIEGQLLDSMVDAAITTGKGRLAARFQVLRGSEKLFDKEIVAESSWESSFVGAVAIPAAINQYGALYKTLVGKLIDDAEFRRALKR